MSSTHRPSKDYNPSSILVSSVYPSNLVSNATTGTVSSTSLSAQDSNSKLQSTSILSLPTTNSSIVNTHLITSSIIHSSMIDYSSSSNPISLVSNSTTSSISSTPASNHSYGSTWSSLTESPTDTDSSKMHSSSISKITSLVTIDSEVTLSESSSILVESTKPTVTNESISTSTASIQSDNITNTISATSRKISSLGISSDNSTFSTSVEQSGITKESNGYSTSSSSYSGLSRPSSLQNISDSSSSATSVHSDLSSIDALPLSRNSTSQSLQTTLSRGSSLTISESQLIPSNSATHSTNVDSASSDFITTGSSQSHMGNSSMTIIDTSYMSSLSSNTFSTVSEHTIPLSSMFTNSRISSKDIIPSTTIHTTFSSSQVSSTFTPLLSSLQNESNSMLPSRSLLESASKFTSTNVMTNTEHNIYTTTLNPSITTTKNNTNINSVSTWSSKNIISTTEGHTVSESLSSTHISGSNFHTSQILSTSLSNSQPETRDTTESLTNSDDTSTMVSGTSTGNSAVNSSTHTSLISSNSQTGLSAITSSLSNPVSSSNIISSSSRDLPNNSAITELPSSKPIESSVTSSKISEHANNNNGSKSLDQSSKSIEPFSRTILSSISELLSETSTSDYLTWFSTISTSVGDPEDSSSFNANSHLQGTSLSHTQLSSNNTTSMSINNPHGSMTASSSDDSKLSVSDTTRHTYPTVESQTNVSVATDVSKSQTASTAIIKETESGDEHAIVTSTVTSRDSGVSISNPSLSTELNFSSNDLIISNSNVGSQTQIITASSQATKLVSESTSISPETSLQSSYPSTANQSTDKDKTSDSVVSTFSRMSNSHDAISRIRSTISSSISNQSPTGKTATSSETAVSSSISFTSYDHFTSDSVVNSGTTSSFNNPTSIWNSSQVSDYISTFSMDISKSLESNDILSRSLDGDSRPSRTRTTKGSSFESTLSDSTEGSHIESHSLFTTVSERTSSIIDSDISGSISSRTVDGYPQHPLLPGSSKSNDITSRNEVTSSSQSLTSSMTPSDNAPSSSSLISIKSSSSVESYYQKSQTNDANWASASKPSKISSSIQYSDGSSGTNELSSTLASLHLTATSLSSEEDHMSLDSIDGETISEGQVDSKDEDSSTEMTGHDSSTRYNTHPSGTSSRSTMTLSPNRPHASDESEIDFNVPHPIISAEVSSLQNLGTAQVSSDNISVVISSTITFSTSGRTTDINSLPESPTLSNAETDDAASIDHSLAGSSSVATTTRNTQTVSTTSEIDSNNALDGLGKSRSKSAQGDISEPTNTHSQIETTVPHHTEQTKLSSGSPITSDVQSLLISTSLIPTNSLLHGSMSDTPNGESDISNPIQTETKGNAPISTETSELGSFAIDALYGTRKSSNEFATKETASIDYLSKSTPSSILSGTTLEKPSTTDTPNIGENDMNTSNSLPADTQSTALNSESSNNGSRDHSHNDGDNDLSSSDSLDSAYESGRENNHSPLTTTLVGGLTQEPSSLQRSSSSLSGTEETSSSVISDSSQARSSETGSPVDISYSNFAPRVIGKSVGMLLSQLISIHILIQYIL